MLENVSVKVLPRQVAEGKVSEVVKELVDMTIQADTGIVSMVGAEMINFPHHLVMFNHNLFIILVLILGMQQGVGVVQREHPQYGSIRVRFGAMGKVSFQ